MPNLYPSVGGGEARPQAAEPHLVEQLYDVAHCRCSRAEVATTWHVAMVLDSGMPEVPEQAPRSLMQEEDPGLKVPRENCRMQTRNQRLRRDNFCHLPVQNVRRALPVLKHDHTTTFSSTLLGVDVHAVGELLLQSRTT